MAYCKVFTLAQALPIGKERDAYKDDQAIFNCALKVQGDGRKSAAVVADLVAFRCVPAAHGCAALPSSPGRYYR